MYSVYKDLKFIATFKRTFTGDGILSGLIVSGSLKFESKEMAMDWLKRTANNKHSKITEFKVESVIKEK